MSKALFARPKFYLTSPGNSKLPPDLGVFYGRFARHVAMSVFYLKLPTLWVGLREGAVPLHMLPNLSVTNHGVGRLMVQKMFTDRHWGITDGGGTAPVRVVQS